MKVWDVYEDIVPAVGEPFREFVGRVEARTHKSAWNKAAKEFRFDGRGIPGRQRHADNFVLVDFEARWDFAKAKVPGGRYWEPGVEEVHELPKDQWLDDEPLPFE